MNEKMNGLHKFVEKNHENICAIAIIKNGKQTYEDYWHGFTPDAALNVMSVTKSIISLLIGVCKDKGFIDRLDQNVLDFFPAYPVKRGEKTIRQVTIRHLLTMTAPYKYKSEPWTKVCSSKDWTKAALDILGGKAGITGQFKYATLGIQILSGIIANSSKMPVVDFANAFLFHPLGIEPHRNTNVQNKEEQLEFMTSKAAKGPLWFADPQGVNTAGWGLCLTARDMAKIGQMVLAQGLYESQRIVSTEWIEESTRAYIQCDEHFGNMAYGYLWWIIEGETPIYAAVGDGGNVIYIHPAKNLAVGVIATFKPRVFDRIAFIQNSIEPLFDK